MARLVRAQILAEREKEFVTAAKAMGIRELSIIFRHILPNRGDGHHCQHDTELCLMPVNRIFPIFLGFGVVEPNPTWGNMLTGSQASTVIVNFWWRWVFPALALSLATISINLIGDGFGMPLIQNPMKGRCGYVPFRASGSAHVFSNKAGRRKGSQWGIL
ncbi:MAG: ABC transporter permease [Clostridia bacterium]